MNNKKLYISITAASTLVANTLLADNNYEIGTITVSSPTKSEQSIEEVTSNVEVITSTEIEEKNYTTIGQALNSISGINYTQNGSLGTSTSIMLRGMDNKRVLVLVDGVNFKDPSSTSGTAFAHIMINDVERIEVVKGAQSSIWGNDATAGIINIITKKAKVGTHSSILVEKGSFNTRKFQGTVSHKEKNYDLKLSGSRVLSDGFTSLAPKDKSIDLYEDDGYQNTTINLKSNYNITDNDSVGVNITRIDAKSNYDAYNAPTSVQRSEIENRLYSVYYKKQLENHNIKFNYNNSDYFRDEKDTTISSYVKVFNGNLQSFDLNDTYAYQENGKLLYGGGYEIYDVSYERVDHNDKSKTVDIKSAYVTNTNSFNQLIATQSLRVDDFSTSGEEVTGKIGFKYNFTKDLFSSINYGTAFNAPNIMELLNPWGAVGKEVTQPEKTKGYDVSLNYKDFSATYFENEVTDMIAWYDPDPTNSWLIKDAYYKNYDGKSIFKGIELSYSKNILEDTLFNINYTWLKAKNSDGEFLAKRPKTTVKFGVDYYGFTNLHLNLNGEYIGTRYNRDNLEGDQTGRYTVFNAVANYDIKKDTKIYLKVDNLTDKYYTTSTNNSNHIYATSPRAYYVGIKYNF